MPDQTAHQTQTVMSADFREAMRGVVGHCTVLTTGTGAAATGLVVSSGTSLTADPARLLACVNRASSTWEVFKSSGFFGWSSLGAAHQPVAERFSGKGGISGADRYIGSDWETAQTGARLLIGAPAAFDCELEDMIDRGTHSILIGRVCAVRTCKDAGALLYRDGAYLALPA